MEEGEVRLSRVQLRMRWFEHVRRRRLDLGRLYLELQKVERDIAGITRDLTARYGLPR